MTSSTSNWWVKYPLSPEWEQRIDPKTGVPYFIDHKNKKTTWVDPRIAEFADAESKARDSNEKVRSKQIGDEHSQDTLTSRSKRPDLSRQSQQNKPRRPEKTGSLSSYTSQEGALRSQSLISSHDSKRESKVKSDNHTPNSRISEKARSLSESRHSEGKRSSAHRSNRTRERTASLTKGDLISQNSTSIKEKYFSNIDDESEKLKSVPETEEGNTIAAVDEQASKNVDEANTESQVTPEITSEPEVKKENTRSYPCSSKLAKGPNPALLSQRISARGPNPDLPKGPNAALLKGPNPNNLRKNRQLDNAAAIHTSLFATLVN